jgi:hypothetical protein
MDGFLLLFVVLFYISFMTIFVKEENDMQEVVSSSETQFWYKDGKQHRDNDLPAVIYRNGTQEWYKNGLRHRDNDLPAIINSNGSQEWYKDGRKNWDTTTAVFDYGPQSDLTTGFQVTFGSRMHNGDEKPSEIYYANGGELNLITNTVSSNGGLQQNHAAAMNMQPNLLPNIKLVDTFEKAVASANTGGDRLTSNHMRNFMECVRSRKQPHAPVEAGYNHSIATIMTNAAVHTGVKVTFDEKLQEVMANGKVWHL